MPCPCLAVCARQGGVFDFDQKDRKSKPPPSRKMRGKDGAPHSGSPQRGGIYCLGRKAGLPDQRKPEGAPVPSTSLRAGSCPAVCARQGAVFDF